MNTYKQGWRDHSNIFAELMCKENAMEQALVPTTEKKLLCEMSLEELAYASHDCDGENGHCQFCFIQNGARKTLEFVEKYK